MRSDSTTQEKEAQLAGFYADLTTALVMLLAVRIGTLSSSMRFCAGLLRRVRLFGACIAASWATSFGIQALLLNPVINFYFRRQICNRSMSSPSPS
jgi:hypothetical protein